MKQSKWILPAICTFTGLLAGFAAGMSVFGYRHKKKATPDPLPEQETEPTADTMEAIGGNADE